LSNCNRNAPVATGVVNVASAGRFSSTNVRNPARSAK